MKHPPEHIMDLIHNYYLLPIVMDTLERESKQMRELKLGVVWVKALEQLHVRAERQHAETRKQLREHGIKYPHIIEQNKEVGLHAEYYYKGYTHHFTWLPQKIKSEVEMWVEEQLK